MQAYIDSIQDEVGAEASPGSEDLDRARCPQYFFERANIKKDDRKTIFRKFLHFDVSAYTVGELFSRNNLHNR